MKHNPTEAVWLEVQTQYVTGQGSLEALAQKHGLSRSTLWLRNRRGGWQALRRNFAKSKITALFPGTPVINPPPPALPEGGITPEWMIDRQRIHYGTNMEIIDLAREHIRSGLQKEANPTPEQLSKLTAALASIVVCESNILGLKNRKTGKDRRPAPVYAQPQE